MALEYIKLVEQVQRMGRMMSYRIQEISERANLAHYNFLNLPSNEVIQERIRLSRERDAGYRGAALLEIAGQPSERPNARYELPLVPQQAAIIAADGSQIYPDQHGAVLYFLTNIGIFTFYHGEDVLPEQETEPVLYYSDSFLRDLEGQIIKNAAVNARRSVLEMQALARKAWSIKERAASLIAISDGPLLFWLGHDVPDAKKLTDDYFATLVQMHDIHTVMYKTHRHNASLVGYIDRPSSRFVVALLQLLILDEGDVRESILDQPGIFEGLDDRWLYGMLLEPGERSALMVQQSPQNKAYRDKGMSYEIIFFYLNAGYAGSPNIVRIEIPLWVGRSREAVNEVHSLIFSQCRLMGRYPYALTRADELAVIRGSEKQALDEMIRTELLKYAQFAEESAKLQSKNQARGVRRSFGQKIK
jgi:hypothetical protein